MVNPEHYDEIADKLNKAGITISENAEFILTERNASITYLIGKKNDEIYRLKTSDISAHLSTVSER